MLRKNLPLLLLSFCAFAANVAAQYVYVLPQGGLNGNLVVYSVEPFAQVASVPTLPDPIYAFSNREGTRTYVLGKSGTIAVHDGTVGFAEKVRYNLGSTITAATLSADRRKILLAAGSLRVIPLYDSGGNVIEFPNSIPNINTGSAPADVAASTDPNRAVVVSTNDRMITLVDLSTNSVIDQETVGQFPFGITLSPSGLFYVSANDRVYEIDARDQIVVVQTFTFVGTFGRPVVSSDGRSAVLVGGPAGAEAYLALDLANRKLTMVAQGAGVNLSQPVPGNLEFLFGVSGGRLYSGAFSQPAKAPALSGLSLSTDNVAVGASTEAFNARYLYTVSRNAVTRSTLSGGAPVGPLGFPSAAAGISVDSATTTLAVTALQNTTLDVLMTAGGPSLPLTVRAVDANGRPVADQNVVFSSTVPGLTFQTSTVRTGMNGLASTRATLPASTGEFEIQAATGGVTVKFTVRATTGSTGGLPQLAIVRGNGQIITAGSPSKQFSVRVRDQNGQPLAGATVTWDVDSTLMPKPANSITDGNGVASTTIIGPLFVPSASVQTVPFKLTASTDVPGFQGSVNLFAVTYPPGPPPVVLLTPSLTPVNGALILPAGGTVTSAFSIKTFTNLPGLLPVPIQNIGMQAATAPASSQTVTCRDWPVTGSTGEAACDLVVGLNQGNTTMTLVVGGDIDDPTAPFIYSYPIQVATGPPAKMTIIGGDGQSGPPGTVAPKTLTVQVQDAVGALLSGVNVTWAKVSGDAEIFGIIGTTGVDGRSGAQVRFGSAPGPIVITATAGSLSTTFHLANSVAIGTFAINGGDSQATSVGAAFPQPLSVKVLDQAGAPIAGATVSFAVTSGPVTLSAPTAQTDSSGIASVTATGGSTEGAAIVSATLPGANPLSFSLTVGQVPVKVTDLVDGAGFQSGAASCGLATILGSGFKLSPGVVSAPAGALPLELAGVTATIDGVVAPISAVANVNGKEQVNVQVPCEVAPGPKQVIVYARGLAATPFIASIQEVRPGIFSFVNSQNRTQGIVFHANGALVTPENPALVGEQVTGYFTGLGQTSPAITTNTLGTGQTLAISKVIMGVNNRGVESQSARYAANSIGIYTVTFTINPPPGTGDALPYSIGIYNAQGQVVYSNTSTIPVRAQ